MAKNAPRKAPARAKKPAPKKKPAVAAKKSAAPVKKRVAAAKPPPEPVHVEAKVIHEAVPVSDVPPPPPKALPPPSEPIEGGPAFPLEIDPKRVEESLRKLSEELRHWANKGRYTKVRFKFRGKQLLPDLPVAAVAAAEGLTFYWGGILRALIFNVAGGSLLQVELVNDADKRVQAGKEALLSGEVDEALTLFREALSMDRDNAGAHLNLGVALKLKGDRAAALEAFERAKKLDPEGPLGVEAERLAGPLRPKDVAKAS
jgi:tetratricopeptide (TPR) repeat protein